MADANDWQEMVFVLLEETFESRDKGGNVYLDTLTGWFPTLEALSAEQASFALVPGGSTVAAHTFHTVFYIRVFTAELRGEPEAKVDWAESWTVKEVDRTGWDDLRRQLRDSYTGTVALFRAVETWGGEEIHAAMAVVTHSAYHLGAVRQFLTALRADGR